MATILCVDDEPSVGVILEHTLAKIGHRPLLVTGVEEAMQAVGRTPLDLIISDYRMPGLTGLEFLALLRQEGYEIPLIMLTGYAQHRARRHVDQSWRHRLHHQAGPPRELELAVQQALEVVRLRRENETLRRRSWSSGTTPDHRRQRRVSPRACRRSRRSAPTRATVLLEGECGTGKELFAARSTIRVERRDAPFIS